MRSGSQPGVPSLTLALLQPADTTLVPVHPQFLQTLSDHLGNHLTADDGFDALLNDPLSTIDTESASVDSLGSVAVDVASAPGTFTPDNLSAIAQDLATFNASGDNITNTFGLAAAPPSALPPDPAGGTSPGQSPGGDAGAVSPDGYGYGGPRGGDSPRIQKILPQFEDPSADDTGPVIL